MDLNTLWFALIAVLFIGFFILEGFDYGVGILLPVLGKTDDERRVLINTIGPFWDANEVWLLTAGGAMFAAFPNWYATMFSGFYVALVLMLLMLILRGVAFEFRSKDAAPRWRRFWDGALVLGSAVPALLWGVAMANLILGVPIDEGMNFTGTFFSLLSPLALLCGAVSFLGFTLLGAVFLCLRTTDDLVERAHAVAGRLWLPVVLLVTLALLLGFTAAGIAARSGVLPTVTAIVAVAALLASGGFLRRRSHGWSFAAISLGAAFLLLTLFLSLYPRVMVSSLNDAWSLTVYTASSSPYTLRVMTIITLTLLPFVLAYQAWSYRVFRKRIGAGSHLEY